MLTLHVQLQNSNFPFFFLISLGSLQNPWLYFTNSLGNLSSAEPTNLGPYPACWAAALNSYLLTISRAKGYILIFQIHNDILAISENAGYQ